MFLTMPLSGLQAGPEEVLIVPKQKSLGHKLTWGEQSGFSAQLLVRSWLVIFLDSGASAPWRSWPLPTSSMSRCLHVLPRCLLLDQGHPCLHRICGFHGFDGKAAGCLGPVLLTAVRRLPSFSVLFLLRALLLKAAIPRGPGAAPGEVWMGSHHATSRGSYHETMPPSSIRGASWQSGTSSAPCPPEHPPWPKPCGFAFSLARLWPHLSIPVATALLQAFVLSPCRQRSQLSHGPACFGSCRGLMGRDWCLVCTPPLPFPIPWGLP